MRHERRCRAAITLMLAALGGCASMNSGTASPKVVAPPPERPPPDVTAVTSSLELMDALPAGDPARQAEMFQAAKDAASLSPTTSNKLKYALALATPGHSRLRSRRRPATVVGTARQA
jgi:hypothetical protein